MTQHRPHRRARTVALLGLIFQSLLTAFFILLTVWSKSEAMRGLALLTGVGTLIWVFLVLIYHQLVLVQEETFESEQLRKERAAGIGGEAIFDMDDEQLLLARRRLQWMYRWMLPAFTLIIIAALLVSGFLGWSWSFGHSVWGDGWNELENTSLLIWFMGGSAFLVFLFSRYAIGMARQPEWRLLRAGASYMMGVTLAAVAVAGTLAAFHFAQTPVPERILAYVLRALLLVLAFETALNFVLDFYRPRTAEEEPRPAFDSRLLGLFSEAGGIARSIADALNYQFGFEVSSTWFYKLMQRSVLPLIGFAILALLAISSLVFIDTNEQAIIVRLGKLLPGVLEPGMHLKYPWPIDVTHKVATATIHELKIGMIGTEEPEQKPDELILWTNKHSQEPHLEVMVATPKLATFLKSSAEPSATQPMALPATQPAEQVAPPAAVSLLRVAVSIQYQIRDAREWVAGYSAPEKTLETIANREIIRYCASADVSGLMGPQRTPAEKALWTTIQEAANRANLNVDIVFLGLQGVHPPESTAEDFQNVVGAEQKMTASIRSAEAEAKKRLSEVAGDEGRANELGAAVSAMNEIEGRQGASEDARVAARERVDRAIRDIGGMAAERITDARAKRWQLENTAHGQALAFAQEVIAKNAAPDVYRLRKVMQAVTQGLAGVRKYIIATGSGTNGTLQLNLQDPMSAPLESSLQDK